MTYAFSEEFLRKADALAEACRNAEPGAMRPALLTFAEEAIEEHKRSEIERNRK